MFCCGRENSRKANLLFTAPFNKKRNLKFSVQNSFNGCFFIAVNHRLAVEAEKSISNFSMGSKGDDRSLQFCGF